MVNKVKRTLFGPGLSRGETTTQDAGASSDIKQHRNAHTSKERRNPAKQTTQTIRLVTTENVDSQSGHCLPSKCVQQTNTTKTTNPTQTKETKFESKTHKNGFAVNCFVEKKKQPSLNSISNK